MKSKILFVLKIIVPGSFRLKLRQLQKMIVYSARRQLFRVPLLLNKQINIIVGAAMTSQRSWYSTNQQWLDITSKSDWEKVFSGRKLIVNVLAEHVFEHLTYEQAKIALNFIKIHMCSGGNIRIAVPDGYHPDEIYLAHVGIAGIGPDAEDHKQLFNCDSLMVLLGEAGFVPELKEGYTSDGKLVRKFLDPKQGCVNRSRGNKKNMQECSAWEFIDANTSLVVDGLLN